MGKGTDSTRIFALLLAMALLLLAPAEALAADQADNKNRVNIVFVLDASNSMNYTDTEGLRYRAIERFMGLLPETGNYLGGVIFSNHAMDLPGLELQRVESQEEKNSLSAALESWMSHSVNEEAGYTNIGEALRTAVDMLDNGGSDMPSYIVFLSDGNTEMISEDAQAASLAMKDAAIVDAAARQIKIYSICLNANGSADIEEMSNFSENTSGEFREVTDAGDLADILAKFEAEITSNPFIEWDPAVFPDGGEISTAFDVPAIGVEEVNIKIDGPTDQTSLTTPEGVTLDSLNFIKINDSDYKQLKIQRDDLAAGEWLLKTTGVPGDKIQIAMQYNSDLAVDATVEPSGLNVPAGTPATVSAVLRSGTSTASSDEEYEGYSAEVLLMDAYGDAIESVPMRVENSRFVAECDLPEGVYYVQAHVTTSYEFNKSSSRIGPLTVSAVQMPEPQPPIPVETPIKKTVYVLPFKGGSLTLDLKTLATDPVDGALRYAVAASSFIEGTDYTIDAGNVLTLDHFSISKGFFTIRATNSSGLSCDIQVEVTKRDVGLMTALVTGLIALVVAAVLIIGLCMALKKPFHGEITVKSYLNGITGPSAGRTLSPLRGRCKLSSFSLDPIGLDYRKCYFQATGGRQIFLITNVPVIYNREKRTKMCITSGVKMELAIREGDPRRLTVLFESHVKGKRRRTSAKRPAPRRK